MADLCTHIAGDVWTSKGNFYITDSQALVDPTTVIFSYSIAGATPIEYTYGVHGPTMIIKLGPGAYQISIDTTGFTTVEIGVVTVTYIWASHGTGQAIRQKAILVRPPVIVPSF